MRMPVVTVFFMFVAVKLGSFLDSFIVMPVARGGSTGSIEPPLSQVEPPPPART